MGSCCSSGKQEQEGVDGGIQLQNQGLPDLPPGWRAVPSRSRPGKFAYQNIHTGERISWVPKEPAAKEKGMIKRQKKKKDAPSDDEGGAVAST